MVAECVRLIMSETADTALIVALGGPLAHRILDAGPDSDLRYWLRVWGTRGLLWAWDGSPAAVDAVREALSDPAWRVREMAAKVVARHLAGDLLAAVAEVRDDPVPRAQAAATRALAVLSRARA